MLRLTVALDLPCVPEISANKYALNIRFIGVAAWTAAPSTTTTSNSS